MSAPELAPLDLTGLDGPEITELAVTLNRAYAKLEAARSAMILRAPAAALAAGGGNGVRSELIGLACEAESEIRSRLAGGAR